MSDSDQVENSNSQDWTETDTVVEIADSIKSETEVTEKDKFKLAKDILKVCTVLFLVVMILFLFKDKMEVHDQMDKIWSFASQGLYGLISLIIGFYFGGKISTKED